MTRRKKHIVAVICSVSAVSWLIAWSVAIVRESAKADLEGADVIIVLGAAVMLDRPSPVFEGRLEHAFRLFADRRAQRIILTGARSHEDTLSEAAAGKRYLVDRGVPEELITIEEISRTTKENLREAKRVMTEINAHSALVVSDPLHMLRSRHIWHGLGISGIGAPTKFSRYQGFWSRARFTVRELVFLHLYWILRR